MRQLLFIISLLISLGINAQVYIEADVTTGCNPLLVRFNIQPESARDSILSYDWSFGDGKPNSLEDSTVHKYSATDVFAVNCIISTIDHSYLIDSTIKVTYSDAMGTNADSTFIPLIINVMDCDKLLNIPNVFSPGELDGWNDLFIVDTDGTSIYYFSVFTRSGTLIYKSVSPTIVWDGRSISGQEMKGGIYYYTISRKDDVFLKVKGFVYLFPKEHEE